MAALIEMAVQHQGILYVSAYTVRNEIENKALQAILADQWQAPIPHSIVYPRQPFIPQKTLAFLKFIQSIVF